MKTITTEQLKHDMESESGIPVIEVLPAESFVKGHLPNARNVPLDSSFDQVMHQIVPQKDARVVVYCANEECPASEKAARRLEAMGYTNVYDYAKGKADWEAEGLPLVKS